MAGMAAPTNIASDRTLTPIILRIFFTFSPPLYFSFSLRRQW
jgi:hypothetical protein